MKITQTKAPPHGVKMGRLPNFTFCHKIGRHVWPFHNDKTSIDFLTRVFLFRWWILTYFLSPLRDFGHFFDGL